ncbi:MAG: hypothetical protein M1834_004756 [Cirrosporium novae-zelandiae]|nr:MAG: hypothetical protein M1834_004756 [Cirrosporium novae-zelandiae]
MESPSRKPLPLKNTCALFLFALIQTALSVENITSIQPFSVPVTGQWDGDDGPWSSFAAAVGNPLQSVRLLPSSGESSIWVILPEGCYYSDVNCSNLRGNEFFTNESSTWQQKGLFDLEISEEKLLGYSGNGLYGFDNLSLGWQDDNSNTLNLTHQVIAGIATDDFYIGTLPLNPRAVNFTNFDDPQTSMLQTLRDNQMIPSVSWGYTAGAYNEGAYGSLILGGYDATRFTPNNLSIPFSGDSSRDHVIAIESITSNATSSSLLSLLDSIYAYIDTTVNHIWLPISVCEAFESTFGLVYDNTTDLYLVDNYTHAKLLSSNPTITFTLGAYLSSTETVDIVFPYSSFDLIASDPLVSNTTRYFPLRRADNDTEYTLGRAFLQNAYMIADYDRGNFSISQTLFPNASVAEKLVSITPPPEDKSQSSSSSDGKLGTGTLVGIIVAGIIAILVFPIGIAILYRRRHRKKTQLALQLEAKDMDEAEYRKPELPGNEYRDSPPVNMTSEHPNNNGGGELEGDQAFRAELAENQNHTTAAAAEIGGEEVYRFELPGDAVILPELEGNKSQTPPP